MGLAKKKVVITKVAQESVREIFDYLKNVHSLGVAKTVKRGLLNACKDLADFSGFSSEPLLGKEYRSVSKWEYLIIYRVSNEAVYILLIIHGRQHPNKRRRIIANS